MGMGLHRLGSTSQGVNWLPYMNPSGPILSFREPYQYLHLIHITSQISFFN